ncbi:MAG TPA: cupin domain-containing protein [Candidatus Binatia bacterium]
MALHIKKENVPDRKATRSGSEGEGSMLSHKGYGNECSLMVATRGPGYHTRPHRHESEQINYVLEGEIWFFVEEEGYRCKQGDFQRVPANKIHWAWNRSDKPAVVAEAHAPGLVGERAGEGAVALFDEGEEPALRSPGANRYVPYDSDRVESKYK